MARLLNYLRLPSEISQFERSYLARMNRIALAFFWLNLPLFVAVAWFNDTGPVLATALTVLTLAGPTIAWKTVQNPRVVSMFYGFTAMCMGGLLVHFGQGPMQIEMHFYFFSLLAVLAMFANPAVILVAAVTVTLHHTVIWALIPASVFNYDASIYVVAVHAAFVVVESVAAVFIARSFFDNVIGLDKIVQSRTSELDARNESMRLVLDNVHQGFLTLGPDGRCNSEHSRILETWFGEPEQGAGFANLLGRVDPELGEWFELGWESVTDGFLPAELALDQLPSRFAMKGQSFRIDYSAINAPDGELAQVLVVISDISAEVAREEAEREQRETMALFERFMADKAGFLEFFAEAEQLVRALSNNSHQGDLALCKRWLHTLKGNAMIFGLESIGSSAHALEDQIEESGAVPTAEQMKELQTRWASLRASLDLLIGERKGQSVELDEQEYEALVQAVERGRTGAELMHMIRAWKLEPTAQRLDRIATQARGIADRLGKQVEVQTRDNGLRLESERFTSFWSSFVHVVRNALDHGIEDSEERLSTGKDSTGHIEVDTRVEGTQLVVEIRDDGRGIDWDRISEKIGGSKDPKALVAALFEDGVSSKEAVSDLSGRGVGMGAVREACENLGGRVQVHTAPGQGTSIQFCFPLTRVRSHVWQAVA